MEKSKTPKEKALELCQKFGYLTMEHECTGYRTLPLEISKKAAHITCDEILELERIDQLNKSRMSAGQEALLYFWLMVKDEIDKL